MTFHQQLEANRKENADKKLLDLQRVMAELCRIVYTNKYEELQK
jgi:hypothetical protein